MSSFREKARLLQGKSVLVKTTGSTFTGTLTSVGTDFLILSSIIRGRRRRLIIRLAEIILLSRLLR
ncbi:hypothetical protein VK70_09920 [Paenibacillus durus ATCC 35681]|uniref:LSM domain-containing protein n=1 Tax=Paenibacillus durus ATCC 35681 TaxID=1333534 RepID=A0A0F7F8X3_PAEDU|nr:hypothetical protein VK70_09920 [Paenibacillus durus ATCC 35681]